ncbi:MAG: response regulator [Deltaproteobacteria bacterium]|nr:response regulator [Deltaproteobacteria bacterium]
MARILVVDDSEMIRLMLRRILEDAGHQVLEAQDGNQALEVFASSPCDLAFVDIFMPGKEGLSTIRELLGKRPSLPVAAISAGSTFTDTETLDWARNYGAAKTLAKPLSEAKILETVAELLGR